MNKDLSEYDKLIRNMAWKYAEKWNMDKAEMYAEGLYVFVLTLLKYQKERGVRFSTYLYSCLAGRLNKYGLKEYRKTHKAILSEDVTEFIWNHSGLFIKHLEYYNSISMNLTDDARNVLGLILQSLENVTFNRKPSLHGAVKHFQLFCEWEPARTKRAWEEVKNWWLDFNMLPC